MAGCRSIHVLARQVARPLALTLFTLLFALWPFVLYAAEITVDGGGSSTDTSMATNIDTGSTGRPLLPSAVLLGLEVAKSVNTTQAAVGERIIYTYQITNTGNTTLTTIIASDNPLGTVLGLMDSLAPSATLSTTLDYVVQESDLPGPLINTVFVTGTDSVANSIVATATASVAIIGEDLGLEVAKSANATHAHVGETVTYTYRITNTGNMTLTTVMADDDLLGEVPGLTGPLAPNATRNVTLDYLVQESDLPGPLANTVTVTGTDELANSIVVTDFVSITVIAAGLGLEVNKSVNTAQATVGETIIYTYHITNTGTITLTNIIADDDRLGEVPGLTGTLLPGASLLDTFDYVVQESDFPGLLVNTVVVTGTDSLANSIVVSDSASVTVIAVNLGLEVAQSANITQAIVGEMITYTYRITNTGNVTLTTITANDDLLGAVEGLESPLAPTDSQLATLSYVVQESNLPGPLVNTVTITGTDSLANTVVVAASASVVVSEAPTQGVTIYFPLVTNNLIQFQRHLGGSRYALVEVAPSRSAVEVVERAAHSPRFHALDTNQ
jgi:uncharacterized repeat protein (TIGR01451 family)